MFGNFDYKEVHKIIVRLIDELDEDDDRETIEIEKEIAYKIFNNDFLKNRFYCYFKNRRIEIGLNIIRYIVDELNWLEDEDDYFNEIIETFRYIFNLQIEMYYENYNPRISNKPIFKIDNQKYKYNFAWIEDKLVRWFEKI